MSTVVNFGFGSAAALIPTLGFGGVSGAAFQPHGVIVRRGKTLLWPEWVEEQKELVRVEGEIKELEEERDELLEQLHVSREAASFQTQRVRLAREITREKKAFGLQMARLLREKRDALEKISRQKRLREEFIKIYKEQEDEDLRVISFIIGDLYD